MDGNSSLPGSPKSPLQNMTPERMNQRDSIFAQLRNESRESSVTDKISQFNSMSLQMQSKQLERKTADAALKRAMLGREEAEAEMRRYKDEVRAMHKALDEGKDRERRVGERLEALLVSMTCKNIPLIRCLQMCRRTTVAQRRHMLTHKLSGKRKSDEPAKRHSRHNPQSSSYKKNSNQLAALSR